MSRVSGNPVLLQSRFGRRGDFELIVPAGLGDGLLFDRRDNDHPDQPWGTPLQFGRAAGQVDAVSVIQSDFGAPGNLELVARVRDSLHFFWRDCGPDLTWHGPHRITDGATGNPVLLQSRFGRHGDFELAYPAATGGLTFRHRDNDHPHRPWSPPHTFAQDLGRVDAITMIQSNYDTPGNLELVARVRDSLHHFWRDCGPDLTWHGPHRITDGATGNPVLLQSRFGRHGDFELAYPAATGGLTFRHRDNDHPHRPWSPAHTFAQDLGRVDAITMIQSNYDTPGNLELVARVRDSLHFFWRDCGPDFRWNGPYRIVLPETQLRPLPDHRAVLTHGRHFTPNASVQIRYRLSDGRMPETTETSPPQTTATDASGSFANVFHSALPQVVRARVSVCDNATGQVADAAL
ncbi:hypothetical protein ACIQF6_03625 [Kitasatospora sp. NPDC092948]|uniref:hypothetical protein n=1 Tax=Kitasatospora sp. NPDC092948 TaxID=3364088 RepID=UPI003818FD88